MQNIDPFSNLTDYERELSKNEIAMYLDMYYRFVNELSKEENLNTTFIDLFRKIKNKGNKNGNIIRNVSSFIEYDYMIQIAELYTINKFYSIFIDSNFKYFDLSKIQDYSIDEKYYMSGSNHFTLDNIIKLIRNALNHNDKDNFQLFRVVQSLVSPDIYLEIFLRKKKLHLKLSVRELSELFSQVTEARSSFNYEYMDKDGKVLKTANEMMDHYKSGLKISINHYYNFDVTKKEEQERIVLNGTGEEFYKIFELDDYQKKAINSSINKLSKDNNGDFSNFIGYMIKDVIPFGMAKISGYKVDINYLFNCLYSPNKSYADYIYDVNNRQFKNHYVEVETLYYTLNRDALLSRSFSLFASYILDTVITKKEININGVSEDRAYYRNSFVHARWYDFLREDGEQEIILRDYEHGDSNIMSSNEGQEEKRITSNVLYNFLRSKVKDENYNLPLSLLGDASGTGYHITFKDGDTIYYCNMSLTTSSPIFILLGERNGKKFICNNEQIKVLGEKIKHANLNMVDPRIEDFCKKMPDICQKALSNFILSTSEEDYRKRMMIEINELNNICTEIRLGFKFNSKVKKIYY